MKKWWIPLLCMVLLSGCGAQETFETVADVYGPGDTVLREIQVDLPQEALAEAMENGSGEKLYDCGDYQLVLETCPSGSIQQTVETLTGLENVTVMETSQGELQRYDFVWSSAGEAGMQVNRCAVLDDGITHYCMTASAEEAQAGELQEDWNALFQTFSLVSY